MSATLYTNHGCPYAHRAEIVAAYKKFSGQIVEVGLREDMPEWYKKEINPREMVPAVKLPDGTCLSESFYVAQYLDESIEPKNELFPANTEIRRRIYAITDAASKLTDFGFGALMCSEAEQEEKNKALKSNLEAFAKFLSKESSYAFGSRFSLADVIIIPFILRFHYILPAFCNFSIAKESPRIAALIDACLAVPAVASTTLTPETYIGFMQKYSNGKPLKYSYQLSTKDDAASERLALTVAYVTKGPNAKEATKSFFTQTNTADEPSLRLPTGESLPSSVYTVEYLAEQFPEVELLPPYSDSNVAAKRLAGRYFVDSINRVFDEISGHIEKRTKNFSLDDDVVFELRNAERVYTNAGSAGKTYLFGEKPSAYDLIILPYAHRAEILLGDAFTSVAPNIVKAVKAARTDSILGPILATQKKYLNH